ncbi:MAG: enoyl-CoA hydratase/isomerase family protein [Bacteroidales bacterium]
MKPYQNIKTGIKDKVFSLTLFREKKRNAINEQTMDEMLDALRSFHNEKNAVLAVLQAKGSDFSAGADLEWMRTTQQMTVEQLQEQNKKLQQIFELWHSMPVFTIALVHGNVVGGAIGLVAASDLVIARPDAKFRFSEVSLGLIPATIAPYVLQRSSRRFIRNAMLTAMPFNADEAKENQLVDIIADKGLMKDVTKEYISYLKKNEPNAVARCKQLLNDLVFNRVQEPVDQHTTRLLAEVRKSEAASQRIEKFFKKSK